MAREIEVKLLVDGASFEEASEFLRQELFPVCVRYEHGNSIDMYWRTKEGAPSEAVRVRVTSDNDITLTSKVNDKGTIEDRVEHEIAVMPSQKDGLVSILESAFGDGSSVLWKWTDFKIAHGTTISVVQNLEKRQFTFIEVEAPRAEDVDFWVKRLSSQSIREMKRVKNSFFDIFVLGQGVLI